MRARSQIVVLLIVALLLVGVVHAFGAPVDEAGQAMPDDGDACGADRGWEPPTDELLPCTNQRAKAYYGCP